MTCGQEGGTPPCYPDDSGRCVCGDVREQIAAFLDHRSDLHHELSLRRMKEYPHDDGKAMLHRQIAHTYWQAAEAVKNGDDIAWVAAGSKPAPERYSEGALK